VNKLVKYFGNLRAINNLSFGVARNECFGLLGINGAGKTTTFRQEAFFHSALFLPIKFYTF